MDTEASPAYNARLMRVSVQTRIYVSSSVPTLALTKKYDTRQDVSHNSYACNSDRNMQETCQRSMNSVGSSDCMVWQTVHECTRTAVPHPAAREAVLEQKTACLQEPLAACLTSHNSCQAVCRRCQHHLSGSRRAVQFKRSQQRYLAFIRTLFGNPNAFHQVACMIACPIYCTAQVWHTLLQKNWVGCCSSPMHLLHGAGQKTLGQILNTVSIKMCQFIRIGTFVLYTK
jgi:hypothetical protein